MKSTMSNQELMAAGDIITGSRLTLEAMRAIADAAVARVMSEGKVPHAAGFKPKYETMLRDEFAGRALTGAVGGWVRTPKEAARLAYDFADAMMEARNANR
ncbi:MAG: hypothetical protein NTX28_07855 [Novosphingobium sp.]|nr:hypothetical protein [Novosphingobium sp.]